MPSVVVRLDGVIDTRFYTPPLNFMSCWSFLCLAWFMFYSHSHFIFQHLSKSSIGGAGERFGSSCVFRNPKCLEFGQGNCNPKGSGDMVDIFCWRGWNRARELAGSVIRFFGYGVWELLVLGFLWEVLWGAFSELMNFSLAYYTVGCASST
jgi:hypothetical protein